MEQSPAGDDDGPSLPAISSVIFRIRPQLPLVLFALLVIASCTEKKEQEIIIKPVTPDSTAIKEKARIDSLAKANDPRKKIYLTFDDGPNAGTMNVLNAVIEEQVPVSFFVVAKHVYDSREQRLTWEKLKTTPGIELCNHSYSHAGNRYSKFYRDPQKVIADFKRSNDSLQFSNKVARMPGRNAWRIDSIRNTDVKESRIAIDSVYLAGFSIMGWDVEWGFDHQTFAPDADTSLLFRRIENLLNDEATKKPGHLVLLAHDQAFRTEEDIQLLKAVLRYFKNNPEYELLPASRYPGVK